MRLLVIFGPPAVGKMTVDEEIMKLTDISVFHNHLSIEPVIRIFPFGTPPFRRLVDAFRRNLIEEVSNSDQPGLIFTFVWSLGHESDRRFLEDICNVFDEKGAEVDFIELSAELEERLIRNRTSKRLLEKPSKRDIEKSEAQLLEMENQHKMNSDGAIPLPERHLIINNTNRTAADVANEIIETLRIPRRTQVC